jgi:hypothetical protein
MVFLYSEDGRSRFLRNFDPLLKTTRRHIPEDRNVKKTYSPPCRSLLIFTSDSILRSSSLEVKQLEREADHLCPSSAKVNNASTPTFVFTAQYLCTCITFLSSYIILSFPANRRPAYRWFDPSILQHVQIPKRSSFRNQATIANERSLAMYTSSVTPASHTGSVSIQSYQCSMFFITFCNFLNKSSDIMDHKTKNKAHY